MMTHVDFVKYFNTLEEGVLFFWFWLWSLKLNAELRMPLKFSKMYYDFLRNCFQFYTTMLRFYGIDLLLKLGIIALASFFHSITSSMCEGCFLTSKKPSQNRELCLWLLLETRRSWYSLKFTLLVHCYYQFK